MIQDKFNTITKDNPNSSTYICFVKTIKDMGMKRGTINRWFNKLVDSEDYDSSDKPKILDNLSLL